MCLKNKGNLYRETSLSPSRGYDFTGRREMSIPSKENSMKASNMCGIPA